VPLLLALCLIAGSAASGATSLSGPAASAGLAMGGDAVAGELLVKFRNQTPSERRAEVLRSAGATVTGFIPALDIFRVEVPGDAARALETYRADPEVEFAEPNFISRLCLIPNDPLMSLQWSLSQIEAASAWDLWRGSPAAIVAVVDSGVDLSHPDLVGKIWRNPGEVANGIDDDGNGFVDDVFGWDFVHNNPDPSPGADGVDNDGDGFTDGGATHGTVVAGIAAAATNNAVGVAGLGWRVRVMAVQTHNDEGQAAYFNLTQGIAYAVDMGATVVNLSTAGPFSSSMQTAVDYAYSHGVVVVAAAGNSAADLDVSPVSPVCNDGASNEVIGVAATDLGDRLADYSNYGSLNVDLSAPGNNILSTALVDHAHGFDAAYVSGTGTSMATPLVSGLVALMKSANPALTNDQVMSILKAAADPIDALNPGFVGQMGAGRINARKTVQSLLSGDRIAPEPPSGLVATDVGGGGAVSLAWTASPSADVAGYFIYQGTQAGIYDTTIDVGNVVSYRVEHLADGANYYFAISAYDSSIPPNESTLSGASQVTPSSTESIPLAAGLSLFSLRLSPLPGSDTPEDLFGSVSFALYAWDVPSGAYKTYPDASVQWLAPRRGYWVSLAEPITLQVHGTAPDESLPAEIGLEAGWNLIGSLFSSVVPWDPASIQVWFDRLTTLSNVEGRTTVTKTLAQAAHDGDVADYAWTYLDGGYSPVTNLALPGALSQLEPERGYWMLANRAATLILPPPRVRGRSAEVGSGPPTMVLRIEATASSDGQGLSRDSVVVGRGEQRVSLADPPALIGGVDIAVTGFGGTAFSSLAYDLRSELPADANWDITVSRASSGGEIVLTWPDLRSLPRTLFPVLVDLDNQQTVLLRTTASYAFESGGGVRRFRLILAQARSLVSPTIVITPLRGMRGVEVGFSLPAAAQVEVEILTLAGEVIWRSGSRSALQGDNSLAWDGRGIRGESAPSGSYLCALRAEYASGEEISAVKSLVLR